jgi:hypothetical protein
MKRQNSSMSAACASDIRIASASLEAPSALRARRTACSSTKKDLRVKRGRTGMVAP